MDSVKKYQEMQFYFDEDLKPQQKLNKTLTRKQALLILNDVLLYCKDREDLVEDIIELKKYVRNE